MPIFWRTLSASSNVRSVMSSPSMQHRPVSGTSRRRMSLSVVDLPVPDSPTMTIVSPSCAAKRDVLENRHVERERDMIELDDRLARRPCDRGASRRPAASLGELACGSRSRDRRGLVRSRRARAPSRRSRRVVARRSASRSSIIRQRREQQLREEVVDDENQNARRHDGARRATARRLRCRPSCRDRNSSAVIEMMPPNTNGFDSP